MSEDPRYQIDVEVIAEYVPEQSDIQAERFVYSYHVTISNNGTLGATLLRRRWLITDGDGQTQEVTGDGVVGEQPHIAPGEQYSYSSGTALRSSVGSMHGHYTMSSDDGNEFDADIPVFTLATPHALH